MFVLNLSKFQVRFLCVCTIPQALSLVSMCLHYNSTISVCLHYNSTSSKSGFYVFALQLYKFQVWFLCACIITLQVPSLVSMCLHYNSTSSKSGFCVFFIHLDMFLVCFLCACNKSFKSAIYAILYYIRRKSRLFLC